MYICVVCSVRKDQQQITKAELCDIVVSLFLDKWILVNQCHTASPLRWCRKVDGIVLHFTLKQILWNRHSILWVDVHVAIPVLCPSYAKGAVRGNLCIPMDILSHHICGRLCPQGVFTALLGSGSPWIPWEEYSHVWLQTWVNSHNLRGQCGSLCNMFKVSCHRDIRGGRMFQGSPGYLSDSLRYIPLHVHVRQTSGDSHELCRVPADLSGSLRYIPLHVHVRQTSGDSHELCRVRQIPENSDRICAKIRGVV